MDVTLRGVLSSSGEPHLGTPDMDGAALLQARREKEATYPEFTAPGRCRLVVVAIETGGRWSDEAVDFVRQLALARAREVPSFMVFPAILAWERRCTRQLSTVCALSFAASLVEPHMVLDWRGASVFCGFVGPRSAVVLRVVAFCFCD